MKLSNTCFDGATNHITFNNMKMIPDRNQELLWQPFKEVIKVPALQCLPRLFLQMTRLSVKAYFHQTYRQDTNVTEGQSFLKYCNCSFDHFWATTLHLPAHQPPPLKVRSHSTKWRFDVLTGKTQFKKSNPLQTINSLKLVLYIDTDR